jgi:hypothetical protein
MSKHTRKREKAYADEDCGVWALLAQENLGVLRIYGKALGLPVLFITVQQSCEAEAKR